MMRSAVLVVVVLMVIMPFAMARTRWPRSATAAHVPETGEAADATQHSANDPLFGGVELAPARQCDPGLLDHRRWQDYPPTMNWMFCARRIEKFLDLDIIELPMNLTLYRGSRLLKPGEIPSSRNSTWFSSFAVATQYARHFHPGNVYAHQVRKPNVFVIQLMNLRNFETLLSLMKAHYRKGSWRCGGELWNKDLIQRYVSDYMIMHGYDGQKMTVRQSYMDNDTRGSRALCCVLEDVNRYIKANGGNLFIAGYAERVLEGRMPPTSTLLFKNDRPVTTFGRPFADEVMLCRHQDIMTRISE